jgi:hypothetical protein
MFASGFLQASLQSLGINLSKSDEELNLALIEIFDNLSRAKF